MGSKTTENVLIIAYGNPLRCDDGIAWRAAEEIGRFLPEARLLCVQQLTPELAEPASQASMVIFFDASLTGEPGAVVCQPIVAEPGELRFSHHLTPPQILALGDRLYSATPRAFLLSINGANFDHGGNISPSALEAMQHAIRLIGETVGKGFSIGTLG